MNAVQSRDFMRPLILLIEAPERAAKHPDVLRRGCLAAGYILSGHIATIQHKKPGR